VRKLIVISAPSGAGKTSVVHFLLKNIPKLSFSISACSRQKRENETDGEDYYFLGVDEFKSKIKEDAFLEWEEVYSNQFYGTLRSEVEKIWKKQKTAIFDIDVVGGINIKNQYPDECLSIFISPPSIKELRNRLNKRGTDLAKDIEIRLAKAEEEMGQSKAFDVVIVNRDLDTTCKKALGVINNFINYKA